MSKPKHPGLKRRPSGLMALEPRFMFDGAAVAEAAGVLAQSDGGLLRFAAGAEKTSQALDEAQQQVEKTVADYLQAPQATAQLSALFNGGQTEPSAHWQQAASALLAQVRDNKLALRVELRSSVELNGALGAFAAQSPDGEPLIYLNADYAKTATRESLQAVLLEEVGHAIDFALNVSKDTAGDEGHAFASLLLNGADNAITAGGENDQQVLNIDGQAIAVETAAPYNVAQIHYVPMTEGDIRTSLKAISSATSGDIQTVIAITATSDGTVVVYDHWEDGYETDIKNPTQLSTRVWTYNGNQWFLDADGDGIQDAGESIVSGTGISVNGNSIILSNAVNPTSPSTVDFDGRDKVGSTKAVSVTRAGWSITPGTVLAGAVNVIDAGNAGTAYTLPVGQNVETVATGTNKLFEYTSAHIIATQNGTTVSIDRDGNAATPGDITTVTLNEGQSYLVNGGLNAGAKITANKAIGVYLIAGDLGSTYENRWFALTPDEQWASSYYAPVSTTLAANPAYVVIYNPDGANIKYETATGTGTITPTGSSGTTWASNSTTKTSYFLMPASAARFYTSDTDANGKLKKFYAVSVIDADATANQTHDWSYSLVPETYLTDKFVVGWGPGYDKTVGASSSLNASPVWVTPTDDTVLYIDSANVTMRDSAGNEVSKTLDSGNTYKYTVKRLQSYRLFDGDDKDQTGLTAYTKDGTLITAAWGEDPSIAGAGNPYLDMGTTITPLPDYVFTKTSREADNGTSGTTPSISNENGQVELGEQIEYTINLTNRAVIDLFYINIRDAITPADGATYVAGSTRMTITGADGTVRVNNVSIPDETDGTPFPLLRIGSGPTATGGYTISDTDPVAAGSQGLKRGEQIIITYRVQVRSDANTALANAGFTITNDADMSGNGSSTPIKFADSKTVISVTGKVDGQVFFKKSDYSSAVSTFVEGESLGLEVTDNDANVNTGSADTLTVTVTNTTTGEVEQVTLTETGATTGIFRATTPLSTSATANSIDNDGILRMRVGDSLRVDYIDPVFGAVFDNPTNPGVAGDGDGNIATGNPNTATATVPMPSETKILYLSADGASGDYSGDLDRNDPRENRDTTTESTVLIAAGNVAVANSDSLANANASSLTFSHTPGSGANRLLLVAVAVGNTGSTGTPPVVSGVTFGGSSMDFVATQTSGGSGDANQNVRVYLYQLKNPISTAQNVIVNLSGAGSIVAGAVTFNGVNLDNPLGSVVTNPLASGSSNSVTITSAANEIIFGVGAWDEPGTVSLPSGSDQTSIISNGAGYVKALISTEPGGNAVVHSYASSDGQDSVVMAVAVRPANFATFTQAIDLADTLVLPAGGIISIVTHIKDEVGLEDGTTYANLKATLTYGPSGTGTTIAAMGSATYSDANSDGIGTLTWTGTIGSSTSLAAGDNVRLVITNDQAGSSFKIDYDSTGTPSRIELPTTTVIDIVDVDGNAGNGVQEIGFYDNSYANGGSLITNGFVNAGATTYIRVKVSDPFGDYDITSLPLTIDGPGVSGDVSITLTNAHVVDANDNGRYKVYEYAWRSINNTGAYTVTATAEEGFEGTVSDVGSGSLTVQALDLGTPSITEFITAAGSVAGATYSVNDEAFLRVTDLDENVDSTVVETVTATVNGVTVTLTETGVNTGVFEADLSSSATNGSSSTFTNLQQGTLLTASYTDNDDSNDRSGDSISVPVSGNAVPVARPNYYTTAEDAAVTGNILTDLNTSNTPTDDNLADSDANSDVLRVVAINGSGISQTASTTVTTVVLPSGAQLQIAPDGAYTYNPNGAFDYLNSGESFTDSYTYTISDGSGGSATATVTITVNGVNDPTLSIGDVTVNEAAGTMTFTVTRAGTLSRATTVNWSTANGTASAATDASGVDYTAASGTLSFAANDATETITVNIGNDNVYEGAETLNIQLSGATNGLITDPTGVGTIKDDGTETGGADNDKPVVSIAATDNNAVEGTSNNTLVFTVTQSKASAFATDIVVSLNLGTVETADITAVTYVDASGATQTTSVSALVSGLALTIPATDGTPWAPVFTFTVSDDAIYEVSEQLTLSVALASGESDATLGTASANGTIYDEDSTSPSTDINPPGGANPTDTLGDRTSFSVADVSISEGGLMTFTVTRTGDAAANQTVQYATSVAGGDSAAANDFTAASGTLTFAPGAATQTFTVQTLVDVGYEGAETFTVTLSNNSAGSTISDPTAAGTILDDGTGPGPYAPGETVADDDRPILTIGDATMEEGSTLSFAASLSRGSSSAEAFTLVTALGSGAGFASADDFAHNDKSTWTVVHSGGTISVAADGSFTLPAGVTSFTIKVPTTSDAVYEGAETFTLTATATASYITDSDTGAGTITDDGTAADGDDQDAIADDDRGITVSGLDDVSEGSDAVFTVTLPDGNPRDTEISLVLSNGSGAGDAESDDYNPAFTAYYFNGSTQVPLTITNGKVILPAGVTAFYVSVPTAQNTEFEGPERFALTATIVNGKSSADTSTIVDDGSGKVYDERGLNGSGPSDDDRPVAITPPAAPPAPSLPAPPVLLAPPPPLANVVPSFASALTPLAPSLVPVDPPALSMIDAVTSGSGFQIPVSDTAPLGLSLYQGITDQFVQTTGAMSRISLPYDAFIHSNKDAVIKLEAKQADNSNLPTWVQFDPSSGVFVVTPPAGFKGKMDLKVVARDDDGREAVAIFRMFIGEQDQQRPQSRDSFTEKLRMAGKRPITLVRVSDVSHRVVGREPVTMKVRAG